MFLATATCMPVNGTVVPRSSETLVAATGAGAGAGGALACGLLTDAAVTSVAAGLARKGSGCYPDQVRVYDAADCSCA